MNVAVRKPGNRIDAATLKHQAAQLRGKVIEMSHAAQAAHLASSLSCADIVTAAYWHVLNIDPAQPKAPLRDQGSKFPSVHVYLHIPHIISSFRLNPAPRMWVFCA